MTVQARRQTLVLDDFPDPKLARVLSPNGRVHWAQRVKANKQVRERVAMEWIKAQCRGAEPFSAPVLLTATYTLPVNRRRDDDNYGTGVLKAVRDALGKLGVLRDDSVEHLRQEVRIEVERGVRRLTIELQEVA